jgi:S-adenosylmethionine hydrolase
VVPKLHRTRLPRLKGPAPVIFTFTDFGHQGPYLGEMRAAAMRIAPEVPYIDLMVDAPAFRPDLAAYLLAVQAGRLWRGDVVVAVVDPGVGTDRAPLALKVDQYWFVGPDNGLFEHIMRRAPRFTAFTVGYRGKNSSASFDGRDVFAPAAALIAQGNASGLKPVTPTRFPDWPDDLDRIVHVDVYGNLVTGRRITSIALDAILVHGDRQIRHAPVFGAVPPGTIFWYGNSSGLVEIAESGGAAARTLGLGIGDAAPVASGPGAA